MGIFRSSAHSIITIFRRRYSSASPVNPPSSFGSYTMGSPPGPKDPFLVLAMYWARTVRTRNKQKDVDDRSNHLQPHGLWVEKNEKKKIKFEDMLRNMDGPGYYNKYHAATVEDPGLLKRAMDNWPNLLVDDKNVGSPQHHINLWNYQFLKHVLGIKNIAYKDLVTTHMYDNILKLEWASRMKYIEYTLDKFDSVKDFIHWSINTRKQDDKLDVTSFLQDLHSRGLDASVHIWEDKGDQEKEKLEEIRIYCCYNKKDVYIPCKKKSNYNDPSKVYRE